MVLMLEFQPLPTQSTAAEATTSSSNPTSKPHFSSSTKSQCCSNSSSTAPCRKLPLPAHTPNFKTNHFSSSTQSHNIYLNSSSLNTQKCSSTSYPFQLPTSQEISSPARSTKSQILTGIPAPSTHKVQQHKLPLPAPLTHKHPLTAIPSYLNTQSAAAEAN